MDQWEFRRWSLAPCVSLILIPFGFQIGVWYDFVLGNQLWMVRFIFVVGRFRFGIVFFGVFVVFL